ncbi:MAG: hypothetical protein WD063_10525 [Pirellulales bacterium]
MATEVRPSPPLDPAIESILARLRRRIRAYVWADGVAVVLVVLGAAFWISLAFDWLFEPPRTLRAVLLVAVGAGLLYVVFRYLVSRLVVRLRNRNMALLLERKFGQFHDSLLTAVELSEQPDHATGFNADMLARVHGEALARAGGVDLGEVFNPGPLARRITLAVALAAAVGVFAVAAPEALAIWARRSLLLSDELWPRKTHLLVEGFDGEGRIKIARGSDWGLVVKADAALGRDIPEIVEVRYSTIDGARGRENMSREGVVAPGEAPFQRYAYTFKSVLAPLEFYVAGGDDRAGPFYLEVVDSPTISRMTLECEYPPYTRRAPRTIPVAGLMQLPRGTQITIVGEANKPLVDVQIDDAADENAPLAHHIPLAAEHGAPQRGFKYALPRLDADKTLLFTLLDADGIRSREAIRLAIAAVADEPPQVDVTLKGIGTVITAAARLPAAGEVSDDYGVAKIWFHYHVDEAPPERRPLNDAAGGQEKLAVADVMELGDLELKPKQRLHWSVQAADECALTGGPNVGTSQSYALEVVTPDELRSVLEARELMLRRRFETIMAELTDTRDLLAAVEVKHPQEKKEGEAEDKPEKPQDPDSGDGAPPRRVSEAVEVERVVQNCERSSHETLQVALAFDDIREEMINNRVDTKELKTRLKEGISDPLKQIVENPFPKLHERLKQLSGQLSEPAAAVTTQASAVAQIDAILVEMRQVLDKMLELETFNEMLDTLRQIIDAQEKVNDQTKRQQKENLRDLIE